jgi:hypothetical protein
MLTSAIRRFQGIAGKCCTRVEYPRRGTRAREYLFASKPPRSTQAVLDYTRLLPPLIFRCATVLDATRRHSRVGHTPRRPSTRLVLDSPTRVQL